MLKPWWRRTLKNWIWWRSFVLHKLLSWLWSLQWCCPKGSQSSQCDSCDIWIHNECSFIAETQHETVSNTNCAWICPKYEFFNFSDSFFGEQVNLETENRFVPLTKEKKDRSSSCGTNKSSFISELKFINMNTNSIRGKKLKLLAFLDFNQPHVVAIQETKIDRSVAL